MHEDSIHSGTASRQRGDSLYKVNLHFHVFFELKSNLSRSSNLFHYRNEVRGIENSFLEAEYQCREGFHFVQRQNKKKKKKSIQTDLKNVTNLICRNRRWVGAKPACKRLKTSSIENSPMQQQCDVDEATNCEHLCMKRPRSTSNSTTDTEVICYCHKGFVSSGTRCFGEFGAVAECKKRAVDENRFEFKFSFLFLSSAFPVDDC